MTELLSTIEIAETVGQRIKQACLLTGRSRRSFCLQQNISYNTLQSIETGRLTLSKKVANRLCLAFAQVYVLCTPEWLIDGQGLPPSRLLPIGLNTAHKNDTPFSQRECVAQEVAFFHNLQPQNIILPITDDAMLPLYQLGDYVGGQRYEQDQAHKCSGLNCIVELQNGQKLVRHFTYGKNEHYYLTSLNPHTTIDSPGFTLTDIQSIAPILWHRRLITLE